MGRALEGRLLHHQLPNSLICRLFSNMDEILKVVSVQSIVGALAFYLVTLGLYRLIFHPLAKFPGPKLAAVSRYYEAYHDVIQDGQYTNKIAELHRSYGTHFFERSSDSAAH